MIKEYVDEILEKEYIRLNTSLYVVLILIIKKSNKELRICINYRALNALTIKNRNVSSLIKEIIIKLCAIKIFIKFDIIAIFNEIRIKEDNKERIIFFTRYELFKYIVILFKLYNASSIFQIFINNILRKYLNIFYSIYLDNILIYNNDKIEYLKYIKLILKKLK